MNTDKNELEYKKFTIDNSTCKRRFHFVYEKNSKPQDHVLIQCPHCQITLYEEKNSPTVYLTREENLVISPTGQTPVLSDCNFYKKIK